MSNDLISRSALIDELKQSGMIVDNDYGNAMVDFINSQPTAYDVDKVIERLEKEGNNIFESHFPKESLEFYNNGIAKGFWKAEEIAKAGGVNENN